MAKENNEPDVFEGFAALVDSIIPNAEEKESGISNADKDIPVLDDIKDLDKDPDDEPEGEDVKTDEDIKDDDLPEPLKKNTEPSKPKESTDEDSLDEYEPEIASYFQEKFAERFGEEFKENKFETIDSLLDYLSNIVEENSKPVYANEEIEKLNEFVTNGGKLEDYLQYSKSGDVSIDSLDPENEEDLKIAIRGKLTLMGYSEAKIKRAIERYDDTDLLREEGEDAIDYLKENMRKNQEKLLEDQKKQREAFENQQREFVGVVEKQINSLDSIKGYKVSDKQRKELIDYIFKAGPDGKTEYQRQYQSDIKNLIESAFFTKYGDQLIEKANKAGKSEAYKDLHQKLQANRGKMRSSVQTGNGSSDSLTNLIGKHLL